MATHQAASRSPPHRRVTRCQVLWEITSLIIDLFGDEAMKSLMNDSLYLYIKFITSLCVVLVMQGSFFATNS